MSEHKHTPKHRKNALVRKWPRIQPVRKHVGEYVPEDRTHERLGAAAPELLRLFAEMADVPAHIREMGRR